MTSPTTAGHTLTIIGHLWVNYDRDVPLITVFGVPMACHQLHMEVVVGKLYPTWIFQSQNTHSNHQQ
jgi:hypothetical protein